MSKTTDFIQISFKENSTNNSTIVNDDPYIGGSLGAMVNFLDNSTNNGTISSDIPVLSSDYVATGISTMSAMLVGFYDNSTNTGNIVNKPAAFGGNSTNDGYVQYATFSTGSADVVTNDTNGVVDVAELYQGGSMVNNGTIQYAKFMTGDAEDNVTNNGTIAVSAYWYGHVWPNPADVTQILVTQPWDYYIPAFNNGDAGSVSAIYVSGGYSTIAEVVSANADFWNNSKLAHDLNHMSYGKACGYVTEGGILYYMSSIASALTGYRYEGPNPNPNGGGGWYIDGVISNLDNSGNNVFYSYATVVDGISQSSGTYTTWNSKFYQGGVPYTGSMAYDEYEANAYGQYVPNGNTAYRNFVNGVEV